MFRLAGGLERPFDSFPNLGIEVWKFLKPIWTVRDCPRTVWVVNGIICAINCIMVCMRPEMVMKFGFTKWNRCLVIGHEQ